MAAITALKESSQGCIWSRADPITVAFPGGFHTRGTTAAGRRKRNWSASAPTRAGTGASNSGPLASEARALPSVFANWFRMISVCSLLFTYFVGILLVKIGMTTICGV